MIQLVFVILVTRQSQGTKYSSLEAILDCQKVKIEVPTQQVIQIHVVKIIQIQITVIIMS